jgi:DnaJ-class molecular chaperone
LEGRAGAALCDDFLLEELKTAFRGVARRLHPDMHPGASVAERERLSRQFAEAHACYVSLRTTASGVM